MAIGSVRKRLASLKKNWGLFASGIVLLVFGIWIDLQWSADWSKVLLYLINLFPGLLLLLTWFYLLKRQPKIWRIIIPGIILTIAASFCAFIANIGAGAWESSTTAVTDISNYDEIIKQAGDVAPTHHFPNSIPATGDNVRFEYLPRFLQGGGHLQLRMGLTPAVIKKLQGKFEQQAKYQSWGGTDNGYFDEEEYLPQPSFFTSGVDDHTFPTDYEILYLDAIPGETPGFIWNHGLIYGVAISRERSEIVYWLEEW